MDRAVPNSADAAGGQRRAALVVNTRARRGRAAFEEAKRLLEQAGFAVDAHAVDAPETLEATLGAVMAEGHRLVVVGGGDGTISAASGAFAGNGAVLGVLPLGTANSFARALGIPFDLAGAVAVVARGETTVIDLGRIGDRHFTNVVSIGLQTAIARAVSPRLKKLAGRAAYLVAAAGQLGRFRHFRCRLLLDGGQVRVFDAALEVRIANGPFKGGVLAAPEAHLDDGSLVIHVVKGRSWLRLASAWAGIARGRRPDAAVLESIRASRFRLETTPGLDVSVDGEVAARTPVEVTLAPRALTVLRGPLPG